MWSKWPWLTSMRSQRSIFFRWSGATGLFMTQGSSRISLPRALRACQLPWPAEQKLDRFRKRRYQVLHQETEAAKRRRAEGKPGARERIEALLDAGSFVELDMFATARATGFGMEERRQPGDGVVVGFGTVDGREVAVYSYDPTFLGGSVGEGTAEKS